MNQTAHEHYMEAGRIAGQVRKEALNIIKEDVPLLEVAEYVENRIVEMGGSAAFPCNISLNEFASHCTPEDDTARFRRGDVVKIDIGVHVEGFIADTAVTVEIGTHHHGRLIRATEEALDNAIASIRDDVQTRTIGRIIEGTIKKYGFSPIKDLTGHSLERYKLHAGATIPNYASMFSQKIRKDMVFAIEPFATYGRGDIKHGKPHIFAVNPGAKSGLRDKFGVLPFAMRWFPGANPEDTSGLSRYPELIEAGGNIVAQSEHTVIVNESGCEVIT